MTSYETHPYDSPPHPAPQSQEDAKSSKIVILSLVITLGIIGIFALAFLLGRQSNIASSQTPTPTQIFASASPTPTKNPTPQASASGTLTPTKKMTGSPTPSSITKSRILTSVSSLDGFRSSNGGGNSSIDIRAGRNTNLVTRGFLTFDLTDLPQDIRIQKATVRIYQVKVVGDPYGVGGNLKIDHLTYGDSLDNADYTVAALTSSLATISQDTKIEWKEVEVTQQVKDDVANTRPQSQFRLHFTTENTGSDVAGDFAYFESGENAEGTNNLPQLIIEYF